ncbi:Integrator complex subunit 9 [Desmophyllum pertusum]|uniref:Integrator complex subunit 9 n=1 Tax=Desmophyllum pertusum TaxID=174260 RepID=A0A9W9YHY2_9CNID|nr:Integrator complex subunit 9 [Desmophyllum pertusum]
MSGSPVQRRNYHAGLLAGYVHFAAFYASFFGKQNLKEIAGKVFIDVEPEICPPEDCLLDFSNIDIIVISNYHFMLALPFITEHSGFKGKIYATEPTVQIGRELMLEMVVYAERVPKVSKGNMWKDSEVLRCLPAPLSDLKGTKSWKVLYSKHDVKASISKIQNVGYSERLDLFGILKLTALSSGYCLGSCNWLIESDYEKLCFLFVDIHHSPLPMDQSMLKNSDVLIMTGITEAPTANPDAMLGEFCTHLATTLRNGGNVLVPCCPSGVLYDLFECLYSYMDGASLTSIPIYFISPVADSSLAYSNIFAEWLCQSKQSKVYLPEAPFPHAELVKTGRLKHFPSIHEPEFPYLEALAPYQPLAMKACYCPIDPRLNFTQANKLIRELQPGHLAIPDTYTRSPDLLPHRTDLTIQDVECKMSTFSHLDVLSLPVSRQFEKVVLSNELANSLHPQEVRPGIAVSTVTGTLVTKDNRYTLEPLDLTGEGSGKTRDSKVESKASLRSCHLWGSVLVEDLIQSLAKRGIQDVHVEADQGGHTLHLAQDDAMIQLDRSGTHIITHGNEALRINIRDSLLECVSQF